MKRGKKAVKNLETLERTTRGDPRHSNTGALKAQEPPRAPKNTEKHVSI